MTRTLLLGARTLETLRPVALLVDGERIDWIGTDPGDAPAHEAVADVDGTWVTPAFCDAHVHATAAGLAADGVTLADAGSLAIVLQRVRAAAATTNGPLLGSGWDETRWPERRPPTAAELAAAAPGRTVRLARVDGHSCVADPATVAAAEAATVGRDVDRGPDGQPTGWLRERASEVAWARLRERLPERRVAAARRRFAADAAARGIGSVHEMGHPALSSIDDARHWAADGLGLAVAVWWADPDVETSLAAGLRPGGDLFIDGSIGSRTAAVSGGYADGSRGQLLLDEEAVAALFTAATRAGVGAGVHAIGDEAISVAVEGLRRAATACGRTAVRSCRHRVEHVELAHRDQIAALADLGVTASVQPAFDAAWGGDDGLYAERLGRDRARAANPLAELADAGVPLAFGSDAPITPVDPWAAVAAATGHRGGHGLSFDRALHAHTVGGQRAASIPRVGRLVAGERADLALWDRRPVAGEPAGPGCVATVVRGAVTYDPAGALRV